MAKISNATESNNKPTTMITRDEYKLYVEEMTGGQNQCQIPYGGTCQRPDILLNNGKYCDLCEYSEFCLCASKRFRKS